MKKSVLPLALALLGVALSGCPVYDSTNSGCYSDVDCPYGDLCDGMTGFCYRAPTNTSITCGAPADCPQNETCSRSGTCMVGACHFASVGCVRGYDCGVDNDRWQCLKTGEGTGGAAGGGAAETDAGSPASSAGSPNVSTGGAPEPASAAGAGG